MSRNRNSGGQTTVWIIACLSIIVVIAAFALFYNLILGAQRGGQTASEAAALAAASEMSIIAVNYPGIGQVGVTDFEPDATNHPQKRADLNSPAPEGCIALDVKKPVRGANNLLASARSALIFANDTGNPGAIKHAQFLLLKSQEAVKALNQHVKAVVESTGDNSIYKHALEVYKANKEALTGRLLQEGSFKLTVGGLTPGPGVNSNIRAQAGDFNIGDNNRLQAYVPINTVGMDVVFSAIGAQPSLVDSKSFTTNVADPNNENVMAPYTVVMVQAANQIGAVDEKNPARTIQTGACAITAQLAGGSSQVNPRFFVPATVLNVSFSGGIPRKKNSTQDLSLWDLIKKDTFNQVDPSPPSKFARSTWFKASANIPDSADADGKGLTPAAPPGASDFQNIPNALTTAVLDWVFTLNDRASVADIEATLQQPLQDDFLNDNYSTGGKFITQAPLTNIRTDGSNKPGAFCNYDARYVQFNSGFALPYDTQNVVSYNAANTNGKQPNNRTDNFQRLFGLKDVAQSFNVGNSTPESVTYRPKTGEWVTLTSKGGDQPISVLCELKEALYKQMTASTIVADVGLSLTTIPALSPFELAAQPSETIAANTAKPNPAQKFFTFCYDHPPKQMNAGDLGGWKQAVESLIPAEGPGVGPEFWWLFKNQSYLGPNPTVDPRNEHYPDQLPGTYFDGINPNDPATVDLISDAIARTVQLPKGCPTTSGIYDPPMPQEELKVALKNGTRPNGDQFDIAGIIHWNKWACDQMLFMAYFMSIDGHNKYEEANIALSNFGVLTSEGVEKGRDRNATFYKFNILGDAGKIYPWSSFKLQKYGLGLPEGAQVQSPLGEPPDSLAVNDCYIDPETEKSLAHRILPYFFSPNGTKWGFPEYDNLGAISYYPGSMGAYDIAKALEEKGQTSDPNYVSLTNYSGSPALPLVTQRLGNHCYYLAAGLNPDLVKTPHDIETTGSFEWNWLFIALGGVGPQSGTGGPYGIGPDKDINDSLKYLNNKIYTMYFTGGPNGNQNLEYTGDQKNPGWPHAVKGNNVPTPGTAQAGTGALRPYGVVFHYLVNGDRNDFNPITNNKAGKILVSKNSLDVAGRPFPNSYAFAQDKLLNGQYMYLALNGLQTVGQLGSVTHWTVGVMDQVADLGSPNATEKTLADAAGPLAGSKDWVTNPNFAAELPADYKVDPGPAGYPLQGVHIHIGAPMPESCCNLMCHGGWQNPDFKIDADNPVNVAGHQPGGAQPAGGITLGIGEVPPGGPANLPNTEVNKNFLWTSGYQKLPDNTTTNACAPPPPEFVYW